MLPEKVCRIKEPKEEGRIDEVWGATSIADRQSREPKLCSALGTVPGLEEAPVS